jgi:hypothetical protein
VCEKWNALAEDIILWKKLSYECDRYSDISNIKEVRCTALFGFRTKYLINFVPSSVLKVGNLKEHFRNWTFSHSVLGQVSRGLHCVLPGGCYW